VSHGKETGGRVKYRSAPGRPPRCNLAKEREIVCACVKGLVATDQMPSDRALGKQVGLSERTVRGVRLRMGLNRRAASTWVKERKGRQTAAPKGEVLCWTPYAGLWLLVPLIAKTVFWRAVQQLQWTVKSGVTASSWALTVLMWAVLGCRRFFHLDDFRHEADLGLALFTGRTRLWADSTVWRLVHNLKRASAEEFYRQTAAEGVPLDAPAGEEWLSMDEHVVEFFTKLKPRPLGKDRVPTRGRAYPAIRLYAPFHLWAERFIGLVVTKAGVALSQVVPDLIAEVRRLRQRAGQPRPEQVDVILDRGGYKGTVFQALVDDGSIRFIAMARGTKRNVRQWAAVPDACFHAYHPQGEKNPNLKITETKTRISGCQHALRTILIRDDTPHTKQRWRAMFTNALASMLLPATVDATYRTRQQHENSFAEVDHSLAGKCLPKPYHLERETNEQGQKRRTVGSTLSEDTMVGLRLVAWLRHWAFNLVRDFGHALGGTGKTMRVGTLVRKYIARPGVLRLKGAELWVSLAPFTGSEALAGWIGQINQQRIAIPWLDHLVLQMEIAPLPLGLAAEPQTAARRVFANRQPPTVT
jgi:hypothetical protein